MRFTTYSALPFSGANYSENSDKAHNAGLAPCAICGKGVKEPAKAARAVVIDGGAAWGDENSVRDAGYMGEWPVGADCHRRFVVGPEIRVRRQNVFLGYGRVRPFRWSYYCTGPNGAKFDNNSIVDLRRALRLRYGRAARIIETWKEVG
jgi:hypothetical protein